MTPSRARLARARTRVHERLLAAGLAPGQRDYRPFVIVGRARTGSNLLTGLLSSHPQIEARGELLKRLEGATVAQRLAEVYGPKPRRIRAVGVKVFYYHPLDDRKAPLWTELAAVEGLHVVHLRRRNVLRTLTSRRLAELTAEWIDLGRGGGATPAAKPKVRFDAEDLRVLFQQDDAWAAECEERLAGHPIFDVAYEDLTADPQVITDIQTFLGVPPLPLRSELRRQNPEPLSELIEGFDELRLAFEHTRWAACFDEPTSL